VKYFFCYNLHVRNEAVHYRPRASLPVRKARNVSHVLIIIAHPSHRNRIASNSPLAPVRTTDLQPAAKVANLGSVLSLLIPRQYCQGKSGCQTAPHWYTYTLQNYYVHVFPQGDGH